MSENPRGQDAGMHCWLELATTDLEGARGFYAALLGWSYNEMPMPEDSGGVYTMAETGGADVGGLRGFSPDEKGMGVPPHWLIYTAVESVDDTTTRATELGGRAIVEPFDIPETGRMSILTGPAGEMFALWQSYRARSGADGVGSFCWGELGTHG